MRNSITFFVILFLLLFGPGNKDGFPISEDTIKFEIAKKYFQKGIRYYNRMQYLAAIEFFRKAVSEYHEYYTAMEYLARSYKLAGFVDEALKRWENLAKLTSNPVAINDKIDTIRYRETRSPSVPILSDFVFSGKYLSSDSGRFHFSAPVDIAIDREKNLYITSFSSGKLIKLNSNGEGITVTSPALTGKLYGVDYSKNRIVVSDFKNDIVYIMDVNCKILKSFGSSGIDHGRFHGPEGVCFDNDGNIYVVDSGNNRIQKFDSDGGFILQFGESGEYEGQLQNPSDIVVFNNVVYVTDSGNNRLSCFDTSGNYIKDIAIKGMMNPRGINVYNDSLIISDEKAGLLSYKPDNAKTDWLKLWDNNKEKFSKLISAVGDREQILYCLDFNKEAVFIFSPVVSRYTNLDLELTKVDIKHYPVVAFYMNVRNRSGKPIYGLKRDDFRIREDGADIHGLYIDYLKNRDPSTSIVICIDRSYKNRKYHYDIPWVSEFILKKMRKNDSVKVINFHHDYWTGNDFDWSRRRTLKALRKREYAKGKSLGKTLYNAISDLLPRLNRRAVILITDGKVGADSFQKYSAGNIIEYAKSHYIPIHIIVFKEKASVLQKIARETGGGIYKASEMDNLKGIYKAIKDSEEYRYVLVYSTFKTPSIRGWWSDVKIEVNNKGHKGVEWGGYFVP